MAPAVRQELVVGGADDHVDEIDQHYQRADGCLHLRRLIAGIWTYLPWVKHIEPRQAPYLNVPFLYARTLIGLGPLWWLSRDLVRTSLRTDAYLLRDHVDSAIRPYYERLSRDWRGDGAEEELRAGHDLPSPRDEDAGRPPADRGLDLRPQVGLRVVAAGRPVGAACGRPRRRLGRREDGRDGRGEIRQVRDQ